MKEYARYDEGTFSSLTKEQKEAVGLLSIGTFLEYFDLMLYVHMAVLLNELFFPKADPHTATIYSAFAFCSTYILRPLGAIIFGWIGDNLGRKITVVITTFMMAFSCIVMAITPTYDERGLIATVIVTVCRIIQGMSSMGEIVGARLYLTELTKPPIQYVVVGLVSICALIGGLTALAVAWFCTSLLLNWRYAFGIGAIIALVGATARTKLREVPEFVDAKRRLKQALSKLSQNTETLSYSPAYIEKVNYKTSLSYLSILSMWPAIFFFIYIYCSNIFISKFNYTSVQVIQNNLYVTLFNLLLILLLVGLSTIIHPIRILKIRIIVFLISTPIGLYLLSNITCARELFLLQLFFVVTSACEDPATPVLYKHFPVFKRFTYSSFLHAIAKLLIYVITSFGIIFITKYFSHWGLLILMLPLGILYYNSINYFEKLNLIDKNR